MKVCITSQGLNLDSSIDPRFGRAQCLLFVETETMDFEKIQPIGTDAPGGAGVKTAKLVIDSDAQVVLTGNCGPNAFNTLTAGGVKVYTGLGGTIKQVIEDFKAGKPQVAQNPNTKTHSGQGRQSYSTMVM